MQVRPGSYSHGTNGLCVTRMARLRDQERALVASDLKRVTSEKARVEEKTFAFSADMAEAQRQISIDSRGRHMLGCQVEAGCWSRVATAVGRITQYLPGGTNLSPTSASWNRAARTIEQHSLSSFVLCLTAGIPLRWKKTAGRDSVTWVVSKYSATVVSLA